MVGVETSRMGVEMSRMGVEMSRMGVEMAMVMGVEMVFFWTKVSALLL